MKTIQNIYTNGAWKKPIEGSNKSQLVLAFGHPNHAKSTVFDDIKSFYPNAEIIGCSTSGEISDTEIYDDSLTLTAVEFNNAQVEVVAAAQETPGCTYQTAKELAVGLNKKDLKLVLVLTDGLLINGTKLIKALNDSFEEDVLITGGLAGDKDKFVETFVWHNKFSTTDSIVLCGFYGKDLSVSHGTEGGWKEFGPERKITKSEENTIYSLDNKPALDLYKKYLDKKANELPASGMLFPLKIKEHKSDTGVIRTFLRSCEEKGSISFASNIPKNATAQLSRAGHKDLINGSKKAALNAKENSDNEIKNGLVIMISCMGRRAALTHNTEEELEVVKNTLIDNSYTGFYSYGEISPVNGNSSCTLHNQTMTITTIVERDA